MKFVIINTLTDKKEDRINKALEIIKITNYFKILMM